MTKTVLLLLALAVVASSCTQDKPYDTEVKYVCTKLREDIKGKYVMPGLPSDEEVQVSSETMQTLNGFLDRFPEAKTRKSGRMLSMLAKELKDGNGKCPASSIGASCVVALRFLKQGN